MTNPSTNKPIQQVQQTSSKAIKPATLSSSTSIPAKRKESPEEADAIESRSTVAVYKRPTSADKSTPKTNASSSTSEETSHAAAEPRTVSANATAADDDSGFENATVRALSHNLADTKLTMHSQVLQLSEDLEAAKERKKIWTGYLKDMAMFGKCGAPKSFDMAEISEIV